MIALTCHIYFDVPSKDHMLCPRHGNDASCKLKGSSVPVGMEPLTSHCHISGCTAALQQGKWSCYVRAVTKWQCSPAKGGKKGKTHLHQGIVWH